MKRALILLSLFFCVCLVLFSAACGGGNSSTSTTTTTTNNGVKKRAFLLNQFFSRIDIIDAEKDLFTGATITVDSQPQIMLVLSNKQTLVYSSSNNGIALVDNALETNAGAFKSLPGATESIVVSPDNKFAYAAIPSTGKIAILDLVAKTDPTVIPSDTTNIPGVRRLVMSKNGSTILAFSDNSDSVTFIDTANSNAITTKAGFDRPYTAVFSSDDSKAFVLNCGRECGGTSAGIVPVDISTKLLNNTVALPAATIAVSDGTNLYVAGTDVVANVGRVSIVNLSSLAATPVASSISDGLHTSMAVASNGKVYIGSKACSNSAGNCLSVLDTTKQPATASKIVGIVPGNPAFGDVQAITPIKSRNVVYVIQNGVLQVYDTTTDLPQTTPTILVTGKTIDVKEVD